MKGYSEFFSESVNIGYKVMQYKNGYAISGANARLKLKLAKGLVIKMQGNGLYLAPTEKYVMDYYSELADKEVLLKLSYNTNDIITGNLDDKEPEISVSKAKIIDFTIL